MRVDMRVTLASHFQVKQSVLGEQRQHVIQETDTRIDLALATAVNIQLESNLRFRRLSNDLCSALVHEVFQKVYQCPLEFNLAFRGHRLVKKPNTLGAAKYRRRLDRLYQH